MAESFLELLGELLGPKTPQEKLATMQQPASWWQYSEPVRNPQRVAGEALQALSEIIPGIIAAEGLKQAVARPTADHPVLGTAPRTFSPAVGVGRFFERLGGAPLEAGGMPAAIQGARIDWKETPEQHPGQKFLAEAVFDPTNAIGFGVPGRLARTATRLPRGVQSFVLPPLELAARGEAAYQRGVAETFEAGGRTAKRVVEKVPGVRTAFAKSRQGAQRLFGYQTEDVPRQLRATMAKLGVTLPEGEESVLRWALGNSPADAPTAGAAPSGLAARVTPEQAAEIVKVAKPEGPPAPGRPTPLQTYYNHAYQDVRESDNAARLLGMSAPEPGQPRNLAALVARAEEYAHAQGQSTTQLLEMLQQYTRLEGMRGTVTIPKGKGRAVTRRSDDAPRKFTIDTPGELTEQWNVLRARNLVPDDERLRVAVHARFISDRYGDTLIAPPTGDQQPHLAVLQRLEREGAFRDVGLPPSEGFYDPLGAPPAARTAVGAPTPAPAAGPAAPPVAPPVPAAADAGVASAPAAAAPAPPRALPPPFEPAAPTAPALSLDELARLSDEEVLALARRARGEPAPPSLTPPPAPGAPEALPARPTEIVADPARVQAARPEARAPYALGPTTGRRYDFRYKIVELDDLIPSHNPESLTPNPRYDAARQPRERGQISSAEQVERIARELNPDYLLIDQMALQRGPMIVGPDNMVESGNGRVIALHRAAMGYPERYAAYRSELVARAPEYGFDPADVAGMRTPVLVRERVTPIAPEELRAYVQEANTSDIAQHTSIEQARADVTALPDEQIAGLQVPATTNLDEALRAPGALELRRSFTRALTTEERPRFINQASGELNLAGVERLKTALLAYAYQGDAGELLVQTFRDAGDAPIKNVQNAILAALPRTARMESLVRLGERAPELTLADDVARVVNVLARLRQERYPVEKYLSQGTLFERELTPEGEMLLRFFDTHSGRPTRIREFLQEYARLVEQEPMPGQGSLFGDITPRSKLELVEQAINAPGGQRGLFDVTLREAPPAAPAGAGLDVAAERGGAVLGPSAPGPEPAAGVGPAAVPEPTAGVADQPRLPGPLRGAAPRYGYGGKLFTLGFESDVDRALYIVANGARRSKHDAEYVEWLEDVTGLGEQALRTLGGQVRDFIRARASKSTGGRLQVPTQWTPDGPPPLRTPTEALGPYVQGPPQPPMAWYDTMLPDRPLLPPDPNAPPVGPGEWAGHFGARPMERQGFQPWQVSPEARTAPGYVDPLGAPLVGMRPPTGPVLSAPPAGGAAAAGASLPPPAETRLPIDLARATPNYNYGSKTFSLQFASDVDKALYIVARGAVRSRRDADYLAWLHGVIPGQDDAGLRALGGQVRAAIKEQARTAAPGPLSVPVIHQATGAAPAFTDPASISREIDTAKAGLAAARTSGSTDELLASAARLKAAEQRQAEALRGSVNPADPIDAEEVARVEARQRVLNELAGVDQGLLTRMRDALRTELLPRLEDDQPRLRELADQYGARTLKELQEKVAAKPEFAPDEREVRRILGRWEHIDLLEAAPDDALVAGIQHYYRAQVPETRHMPWDNPVWQEILQGWRQLALWSPRYHFMNISDAWIKSLLTYGKSGFTPGADPRHPREFVGMVREAWRRAGAAKGHVADRTPEEILWEATHPGTALPTRVIAGTHVQQVLGDRRAFERVPGPIGRVFRANHELANVVERSARTAAYMEGFDRAKALGKTDDEAIKAGLEFSDSIHFNYADTTNLDEWLRQIVPFHLYATRNYGAYARILAQHPGLARALLEYERATKEDQQAAGLGRAKRFENTIPIGRADASRAGFLDGLFNFGETIAGMLFGRDGTIFFNPMKYISITEQVMQSPMESRGQTALGTALTFASQAGVGPGPWIQVPLQVAGVYGNRQPSDIIPQARLVRSVAGAMPVDLSGIPGVGHAARAVGAAYGATNELQRWRPVGGPAPVDESYYVKRRLAEMALERYPEFAKAQPWQPIHPEFQQAMIQGAANPLYQEARRQLAQAAAVEAGSGFMGVPLRFLGDTQGEIARAEARLPEVNARGGERPLFPVTPTDRWQPGQELITPAARDWLARRQAQATGNPAYAATAGMPRALDAPRGGGGGEMSSFERQRQVVMMYEQAKQSGNRALMQAILADPAARAYLLDDRVRRIKLAPNPHAQR